MNDTAPEVAERVREMMMSRSDEERFVMGALMFDAARELIIASIPTDLPASEFKQRLFERIYGYPLEFIADGELVEVTPQMIRLRKRVLRANERPKKKEA